MTDEREKYMSSLVKFYEDKEDTGDDGESFNLTEDDIKNAVKEGVIEGVKELLSGEI